VNVGIPGAGAVSGVASDLTRITETEDCAKKLSLIASAIAKACAGTAAAIVAAPGGPAASLKAADSAVAATGATITLGQWLGEKPAEWAGAVYGDAKEYYLRDSRFKLVPIAPNPNKVAPAP
jgi:hypothetical protein